MKFRHEYKHEITYSDAKFLRDRLSAVMYKDSHCVNGKYHIRSMYFDNISEQALKMKIDGVNFREKFRIRYYNGDTSMLFLEKKSKLNGLCNKEKIPISYDEAKHISNGNIQIMPRTDKALMTELYSKMKTQGIYPKTIVDYDREPFVFTPGNVRVTIDYNIRTGIRCVDFLNPDCVTIPAGTSPIILEVKWDEFLPSVIRDIVQIPSTHTSAFSKYAICCIYN